MATEEPFTSLSDAELVARAQAGDASAFEALVTRYRGRVYGVCLHYLGDPDEAADLAQEAFVQAWLRLGQLRDAERFGGWLRRVAANLCRSWQRRPRPLPVAPEELAEERDTAPDSVEDAVQRRLDARRVREALSVLSEPVRLTVTLFYMDGYTYAEIARFLDLPVTTVRGRLRDARRRLRKELWTMAEETLQASRPGPEFERAVSRRVEVGRWYRSFAEMIKHGVSLVRSLATLERDPFSPEIHDATARVRQAIENGETLSAALRGEPVLSSPMAIGLVRAGEIGGILDETLAALEQWQRTDDAARHIPLARWCRTLGMLLRAGVPIMQSLETVADLPGGESLREVSLRMRSRVREGQSVAPALHEDPDLFPAEVAALLLAGEESGHLDAALLDAAHLLVEDLSRALGPAPAPAPKRGYLAALQRALSKGDPADRMDAAALLGRLGGPDAVPALARSLADPVPAMRAAAVRALGEIGTEAAITAVARAARDSDAETRLAAAEALAGAGGPSAAVVLTDLAHDPDART